MAPFAHRFASSGSLNALTPPVFDIPSDVRRSEHVRDVYSELLDQYGPVIIVPRHGRREYIIDHRFSREVLTNTKNFEFEKVVYEFLHLRNLAVFDDQAHFVHDIDGVIETGVQPRMNSIIDRIFPIFETYFERLEDQLPHGENASFEITDPFRLLQLAIAHAMVVLVLGESHSSESAARDFGAVAIAMAKLTGLHENTHQWTWFPALWILINGLNAVLFTILPCFFLNMVPSLFRERHARLQNGLTAKPGAFVPLLDSLLAKHYNKKTGLSALTSFAWCVVLCVGLMFASIHQTVVACTWILIALAQRRDAYLPQIRHEFDTYIPPGEPLTVPILSKLTLLDSFIREVMRTKGDTFGPVRQTTKEIFIGQYMIPKGATCMPLVSRAQSHSDFYGDKGKVFDGFQWAEKRLPAAQGNDEFLCFGLGRWACPGRQLAIHEIKIMLYMIFSRFDVSVKEGTFKVVDQINRTAVPPEATLVFERRKDLLC